MIRRVESDTVWVISQTAHAYIAGQIAGHWIGSGKMAPTPREELLIAAYNHDAGWTVPDQQPRINAEGQPRTFTEMDMDEHFDIWRRSIEAVFVQNRYAGLLTSRHCTALYEMRLANFPDPPATRARIKAFLETQHAWEDKLIATMHDHPRYALAVEPDCLAENLRLLQVWDYLSLLVCMSTVREQMLEDVPLDDGKRGVLRLASDAPRSMLIDPFPLDQPLTLWIDARQVNGGPFADDTALRHTLAGTSYRPLVFEIGSPVR